MVHSDVFNLSMAASHSVLEREVENINKVT